MGVLALEEGFDLVDAGVVREAVNGGLDNAAEEVHRAGEALMQCREVGAEKVPCDITGMDVDTDTEEG